MVILGDVSFGRLETGDGEPRLVPRQPGPDNGVDVMVSLENDGEKTLQRAVFSLLPYDADGRTVSCAVKGQAEARLTFAGAVEPGQTRQKVYWRRVWYGRGITGVKLVKLELTYADGSTETLQGPQLRFRNP